MTNPTNWPNPERPGVPMFPERDGPHAIRYMDAKHAILFWNSTERKWISQSHSISPKNLRLLCAYIGPVLTPTQISEMLASERERCVAAVQSEQLIDVAPDCSDDVAYNVALQHAVSAIQRLGDAT